MKSIKRKPIEVIAEEAAANNHIKMTISQEYTTTYTSESEEGVKYFGEDRQFDGKRQMTVVMPDSIRYHFLEAIEATKAVASIRAKFQLNPFWNGQTPSRIRTSDGTLGDTRVTALTGKPIYVNHYLDFKGRDDIFELNGEGITTESKFNEFISVTTPQATIANEE